MFVKLFIAAQLCPTRSYIWRYSLFLDSESVTKDFYPNRPVSTDQCALAKVLCLSYKLTFIVVCCFFYFATFFVAVSAERHRTFLLVTVIYAISDCSYSIDP
jgi:hypothetical protein